MKKGDKLVVVDETSAEDGLPLGKIVYFVGRPASDSDTVQIITVSVDGHHEGWYDYRFKALSELSLLERVLLGVENEA